MNRVRQFEQVTVQYRQELGLLIVRWHAECDDTELQAVYLNVLNIAKEVGCYRWLMDVRRREQTSGSMEAWYHEVYRPLLGELPGKVRTAYLVSLLRMAKRAEQATAQPVAPPDIDGHPLAVFTSEDVAVTWLSAEN